MQVKTCFVMIIVLEKRGCIAMKKKRSVKTHAPELGLKKLFSLFVYLNKFCRIYFPKNIVLNGPI